MTYSHTTLRPAMTAIAAAIAFTSTPLLAQSTEPDATTPAPPVDAAPTADPLAPEPTVETPTVTEPAAPVTTSTKRARTTATKTTTTRTTAAKSRPAPSRAASAAPAAAPVASPTPAVTAAVEQPVPAQPEPIVPVAAAVAAPEAPAPTEQPTAIDNFLASDEALPIAGAAGLGLLALAGAGLVVGRRRRRREDAEFAAQQEYAESLAEPGEITEPQRATMEPTFVRAFDAPVAAPAVAVAAPAAAEPTGPATALPEGFDLSRFGPHVQAAYKGPTADNPSASLKTRLRRAAALDQMARRSEAEPARPAETPAAKPAVGRQERADFMLARDGKKPSERPAYSTTLRPAHTH